ncbi:alpha/beta hydrolase [Paramagnetospirillum magneticum]|uniref:Predicted esterase n=1 Tax=Paramagnetospirillum magneticum (strain ATCC 700264 / AMB-1) TaxID=342108 RepID=Q2VZ58_PARM1|nr:dienelactone hydrolase family protein [Paramagnetospirillum magneticum]BAE53117.1 Predicted esterase [Paramagnetospirillum magneticum AMB-1]
MPSPSPITLSGPSVEPASGGPAAQLVVLLHGVGVDGSDLIELAPFFASILPDAAFVAPDAPFAFDMAPFGRQWFSLQDRSIPAISAGVRATAPILEAYIDEQVALWGVQPADVALIGFSQGTMMALHVALRRPVAPAAVVGFSGALVDPDELPKEITARPRTLLIHGADDEVVNPNCLKAAEQALAAVGVPVLTELRPGLGHGIDGPGAQMALGFLGQVFGVEA